MSLFGNLLNSFFPKKEEIMREQATVLVKSIEDEYLILLLETIEFAEKNGWNWKLNETKTSQGFNIVLEKVFSDSMVIAENLASNGRFMWSFYIHEPSKNVLSSSSFYVQDEKSLGTEIKNLFLCNSLLTFETCITQNNSNSFYN